MDVMQIRLLLDFGMLVLIWIIQLVVYPSFCAFTPDDLKRWHGSYVRRISYVVMPLMILQVIVIIWQAWLELNVYTVGSFVLVCALWLITFLRFVPMHNSIAESGDCGTLSRKLTQLNGWRTLLWTVLFVWSFILALS
ncbi:hypothetical protein [Croceiramulus getboli]|nr:hypothetical protein P8624_07245 [Flavobacteriaceae bacterium YJPT1-3]